MISWSDCSGVGGWSRRRETLRVGIRAQMAISKNHPLFMSCHGRRSSIEETLLEFREFAQIVTDVVVASTAQGPIKGSSEAFSGKAGHQGLSEGLGFCRRVFQGTGMCIPTRGSSLGNHLGHRFGGMINQIHQHFTRQEESFVAFSIRSKKKTCETNMEHFLCARNSKHAISCMHMYKYRQGFAFG